MSETPNYDKDLSQMTRKELWKQIAIDVTIVATAIGVFCCLWGGCSLDENSAEEKMVIFYQRIEILFMKSYLMLYVQKYEKN